jgi:hypothetical protein
LALADEQVYTDLAPLTFRQPDILLDFENIKHDLFQGVILVVLSIDLLGLLCEAVHGS